MFKDIILYALLLIGARFAWGMDMTYLHEEIFRYVTENHASLLGTSVAVVLVIFLLAFMCGMFRCYSFLYLMSTVLFEISQLVIVFVSCDAIVLWFDAGINLWQQLGFQVLFMPYMTLAASCYGFRLYDFNYPLQDRINPNLAISILSGLIIVISPFVA